jgi:AbrB family looped-hinge helix DNA binding protein
MKLTATITRKGCVAIPAILRNKLNLRKGTILRVSEKDGAILLEPLGEDAIALGRGMLTTGGRVLSKLIEDRKLESAR